MNNKLCDYGCGQPAQYQFKNGKYCCSDSTSKCPALKSRFISAGNVKYRCPKCSKLVAKCSFKKHIRKCRVNICLNCGAAIDKGKKFCGSKCAAIYNNKNNENLKNSRRGPNPTKDRTCRICGIQLKNDQKSFCSNECKQVSINIDIEDGKCKTTATLKRYLIKTKGHRCSICGLTEWNHKPAPLVLDHIDGNSDNNNIFNLRLVCGNCDMQLPTYKGKNLGNGRYYRRERYKERKSY